MARKNQTAAQRQDSIFKFIKEFLLEKGFPPSVREIGLAVGLRSSSTVHAYLDMLEDRGLIYRDPAKPRAIDILDEKPWHNNIAVPLVKEILAPKDLLDEKNVDELLQFPSEFVGVCDMPFMVRAEDDMMTDAGIFEGDYVLVHMDAAVQNGDIVVAIIDGEKPVIRSYSKDRHGVRLAPARAKKRACYPKRVTILGKATGVYRRF